jgi:2-(1,2-epoxy-1,2-dihydrophenyl)acetyl-CoA isomerase
MSEYETVKYRTDGAVAVITISRPEAMNSFDEALRAELADACKRAACDNGIRAVVLHGEGRSFSAGADLKSGLNPDRSIEQVLQEEYRPALEAIWNMEKPVIAAVGGSAAGIGTSFALICDLLVMGENAFLLSPFTTISLVPDGGLNWLLVHQLGYRRAFQLSIESDRIPADRCLELGLANKVVPADDVVTEAIAWAGRLAERAPLSVAATKKAMRHATSGSWASTFDIEAPMQQSLRQSDDCAEGIQAFFEKRKPRFKGK